MFYCSFCGYQSSAQNANFCATCGPNGPSATWNPKEVDTRENLERFTSILTSLMSPATAVTQEQVTELRSRLKISHSAWEKINEHFNSFLDAQSGGWPIAIYFKYDAENTFALGDTLIEFEIKNLTKTRFFNASITWDDPETERLDLQASTRKFISPNSSATVGAAVVFDRSGQKEINDLSVTITDETGNNRTFCADGFRVNVRNPSVSIQNTVNTTNTISIEGRGVVDAQGFGSQTVKNSDDSSEEKMFWEPILITPAIDYSALVGSILGPATPSSEVVNPISENEQFQTTAVKQIFKDDEFRPTEDDIIEALEMIEIFQNSAEYDENYPNKPQYTSSLWIKIPNPEPLKYAQITYFVNEGDEVESQYACCSISVGNFNLEFDFILGGVVIHTLGSGALAEKITENATTSDGVVELEIATTLDGDVEELTLQCIEHDGLIFLDWAPHNLILTLGAVEGSDFGFIGYAEAPDFGWSSIPLVMSDETLDLRSLEQVMKNGSRLYPVGGIDLSVEPDPEPSWAIAKVISEQQQEWQKRARVDSWIKKQDKVIAERKKRKKWFS